MSDSGRFVAGIDAGGTRTLALLAAESGEVVSEARGAGANLQTHGEARVEKVLGGLLEQLADEHPISALCLGLGGAGRPQDEAPVRNILRRLGFREPSQVVEDAVIALVAGAPGGTGIVLLAGLGSVAYGVDPRGRSARAGGFGPRLSDEGSGHWLGDAALRAALRAVDGRGPETLLTKLVFASLGVPSPAELLGLVYEKGLPRHQIGALAGAVQKARDQGDAVAAALLEGAAGELALAVRAVAGKLDFDGQPFPVVLAGGAFRACPSLLALLQERLELPAARPARLEVEPAQGAVTLARRLLAPA